MRAGRSRAWAGAVLVVVLTAALTFPASASALPSAWLPRVNALRAYAGLPAAVENPTWSYGCEKHCYYMVRNGWIGHYEDPGNSWYTPEGDAAARASNLFLGDAGIEAIDGWMRTPFHGVGIIDPRLGAVGFGSYDGLYGEAAALDVIRGLGAVPPTVSYPVFWPGNGAEVPFTSYLGGEWPDPLVGTGYQAPAGLPIFAQFGQGSVTPVVQASSLRANGVPVAHTYISEVTYNNPDTAQRDLGRGVLGVRDCVVIIPRDVLSHGTRYDVSLTVNGTVYSWWFRTASLPAITRTAGADRYATSAAISRKGFPSADAVVVASGAGFPDALSASGLAGSLDAPLLLTRPNSLPAAARDEIARLGCGSVVVVGGTGAVSDEVLAALRAIPGVTSVERLAGVTRYETAQLVAERVAELEGPSFSHKAFLVRGDLFPDALAASPLAVSQHIPVLLTSRPDLSSESAAAIEDLDISEVIVAGGVAGVTDSAVLQVEALNGGTTATERWWGLTRYSTAVSVAEEALSRGWATASFTGLATGWDFADALSGGVLCGDNDGVLLLTDRYTLYPSGADFVWTHRGEFDEIALFGGRYAIDDWVISETNWLME